MGKRNEAGEGNGQGSPVVLFLTSSNPALIPSIAVYTSSILQMHANSNVSVSSVFQVYYTVQCFKY